MNSHPIFIWIETKVEFPRNISGYLNATHMTKAGINFGSLGNNVASRIISRFNLIWNDRFIPQEKKNASFP